MTSGKKKIKTLLKVLYNCENNINIKGYEQVENIINKIKNEKRIGYMFPETFDIDVNKESIYWKCLVKIPIVEYEEYISIIKTLNTLSVFFLGQAVTDFSASLRNGF